MSLSTFTSPTRQRNNPTRASLAGLSVISVFKKTCAVCVNGLLFFLMLLIYPSPGVGESIRGGNLSGIVSIPSGLAALVVGRNCAGGNRGHPGVGELVENKRGKLRSPSWGNNPIKPGSVRSGSIRQRRARNCSTGC